MPMPQNNILERGFYRGEGMCRNRANALFKKKQFFKISNKELLVLFKQKWATQSLEPPLIFTIKCFLDFGTEVNWFIY